MSAEEDSTEPEKPLEGLSVDKMKTLPNNPLETPLQLTIRAPEGVNEGSEIVRSENPPSQVMLHPISTHPVISMSHNSQSFYQQPSQQQQPPQQPYHVSMRESPSSGYHIHPAIHQANSHHAEQMNPQHLHHQQQIQHGAIRHPSPDPNDAHEPMTVKDLMLATIERQLRRNPVPNQQTNHSQGMQQSGAPPQSVSPTIQSILKSQERGHMALPVIISTQPLPSVNHHQHPNMTHATQHFHPAYYKPDMRSIPPQQQMIVRENIPVVHIQHAVAHPPLRDECETLDLSMKKRTPSPQVSSQRPPSSGALPPPAHQQIDYANRQDVYYPKYPMNRSRQLQPQMTQMKPGKVLPPPPLLTKPPTVSPHSSLKDGSITHGTPLQMSHPVSCLFNSFKF